MAPPGELELYAVSRLYCCIIEVNRLKCDRGVISTYTHTAHHMNKTVCILRLGPRFTLKVDHTQVYILSKLVLQLYSVFACKM